MIFTEALTHGTLPWTAPFQRRHLLFKYSPGNSAWDRNPSVPTDVLPLLTERQRLLAEPPYVGGRVALELSSVRESSQRCVSPSLIDRTRLAGAIYPST